ncbi:MAG: DnaJ domain-containing protein [Phycisphaerales bacterium]
MQWSEVMSWLPKRQAKKPRAAPRQQVDGFMCQLGSLMDISATGMRLRFDDEHAVSIGAVLNFQLRSAGMMFCLRGTVIWKRKQKKSGAFECGVRFLDLSPEHRAIVEHVARFGVMPRQGERLKQSPQPTPGAGAPPPPPNPPMPTATVAVEVEDLYKILGVSPTATQDEIRAGFRALARIHHPDFSQAPDADAKFTVISKAFTVLRDPNLRAKYDQLRQRSAA